MHERSDSIPVKTAEPGSSSTEFSNQPVEHLIEQLRQRSAELEEANREMRRVSHYRSLFLARMSHELRTPLTSILGFSEILLDQEQLTETQRRFCQKIQDSGLQLQSSLNQLVDLSRLEAGQTELFYQEFSVREMLRDSCAAVMRPAKKRDVGVEYDLPDELTTVVSDQGKLRQILYSFLSWSVSRCSPGGHVNLHAEVVEPVLRLKINDDGEQVSDLARVFEPDAILSDEPDVNDLGIIIGRKLIEIMNGRLWIRNIDSGGLETIVEVSSRPAKA